jgi:hypothetical protein
MEISWISDATGNIYSARKVLGCYGVLTFDVFFLLFKGIVWFKWKKTKSQNSILRILTSNNLEPSSSTENNKKLWLTISAHNDLSTRNTNGYHNFLLNEFDPFPALATDFAAINSCATLLQVQLLSLPFNSYFADAVRIKLILTASALIQSTFSIQAITIFPHFLNSFTRHGFSLRLKKDLLLFKNFNLR